VSRVVAVQFSPFHFFLAKQFCMVSDAPAPNLSLVFVRFFFSFLKDAICTDLRGLKTILPSSAVNWLQLHGRQMTALRYSTV